MGFLGMGVQEIVIIAIVALIIFGPDRLPELAGQAGKALRDLRRMTTDMTGEFERETGVNVRDLRSQVDKEIAGVKSELTGATSSLQKEVTSAKKTVQGAASAAKGGTKSATASSSTGTAAKKSGTSVSTARSATGAGAKKTEEVKPVASKSDPLADVSVLDNVGTTAVEQAVPASAAAAASPASGTGGGSSDRADALQRARNRRLAAGYNQPR